MSLTKQEQDAILKSFYNRPPLDLGELRDFFGFARMLGDNPTSLYLTHCAERVAAESVENYEFWLDCLKYCAPFDFDSYMLFLESRREPEKQFYLPRRRRLRSLVRSLQDLHEKKILFLGVSMPPRVGKSTTCVFFTTWQMGLFPDRACLMSGHSAPLTEGFYREALDIVMSDQYRWREIFPDAGEVKSSALLTQINVGHYSRYPSLTCRSVEATLTGAVEAERLLYTDDLVKGRDESLNPVLLEKKYQLYLNELLDRKLEGAIELMVGTRWNVADPLGRLATRHVGDPNYRFLVMPALDENGQSNFEYEFGRGFSTEYYQNMRQTLDDNEWMAKFQGRPFVREGLLFPAENLDYFDGTTFPVDMAELKMMVVDVAFGGGDYLAAIYMYRYQERWYLMDVVYNNGLKDVTYPLVVGQTLRHEPHVIHFEANNGGEEYQDYIKKVLKDDHSFVANYTTAYAPTRMKKEARIIQHSPEIMNLVYFRNDRQRSKEYDRFMEDLCSYSIEGKNLHDDAPDVLTIFVQRVVQGNNKIEVSRSRIYDRLR